MLQMDLYLNHQHFLWFFTPSPLPQYIKSPYNGCDLSISDCLLKIVKEEGVWSLWNGTKPSIVLATNPAIHFMVYEAIKRYFQHYLRKDVSAAVESSLGLKKIILCFRQPNPTYQNQLTLDFFLRKYRVVFVGDFIIKVSILRKTKKQKRSQPYLKFLRPLP